MSEGEKRIANEGQILLERLPFAPVDARDPYLPIALVAKRRRMAVDQLRKLILLSVVEGVKIDGKWFTTYSALKDYATQKRNGRVETRKNGLVKRSSHASG